MRPGHSARANLCLKVLPRWRTTGVTGKRQGSQNNRTGAPAAVEYFQSDVLAAEPKLLAAFVRPYFKIVRLGPPRFLNRYNLKQRYGRRTVKTVTWAFVHYPESVETDQ